MCVCFVSASFRKQKAEIKSACESASYGNPSNDDYNKRLIQFNQSCNPNNVVFRWHAFWNEWIAQQNNHIPGGREGNRNSP